MVRNTEVFKDLFPTYEAFAEWYKSTPLSDGDEDVPSKKTFTLIFYRYMSSHACFLEEDFKAQFALTLYSYYKEFEATTKAIDELMQLTDEQISIGDSTIVNVADIPETPQTTDIETVDFVSNQQKQINKKGNLQIKREQLSNKRAYTVKTFLNRFSHLFVRIFSQPVNYLVEDNY